MTISINIITKVIRESITRMYKNGEFWDLLGKEIEVKKL
jgi:hypothetical protein